MSDQVTLQAARAALEGIDYGKRGLTRNELRERVPDLPAAIYLHLPDSKRFDSAAAVLHEVSGAAGRAEGEFMAADDDTPSEGAEADYGPAAYGTSPLVSPTLSGDTTNTPVPGFDGNSLETEREYSD